MGSKNKNQIPISANIKENQSFMKERVGVGISFDLEFRELIILKRKVQLYFLNGQISDQIAVELVKKLADINDEETNTKKVPEIIENRLANHSVEQTDSMDEAIDQMLSGLIIVLIDGEKTGYIIDVREYPGRQPEEPDTERVIRGARDGFTENVIFNTALTRRRIRDERLRHEMLSVGERSKTDVCLCYIQDIADDGLIETIKERLKAIEVDAITMADKAIEEFIVDDSWNPFPLVRYTERPDVAANHLLEGFIVLMVDTSPSVIILPTTIFDHLEHAEEYRQTPAVGTFIRWVRILAVLASVFLVPIWMLFAMEPELLPKTLSFIGPSEEGNVPLVAQIIVASLGIEFLRMAAVHTPTPLATALGIIAAVLIGDLAVDVGMFSPEVVMYVAVSTTGNYVTPSYELSVATKFLNFFLIIATAVFGVPGFMGGLVIATFFLINLKSIRTPYLWPFLPFNAKAIYKFIFRIPVPFSNKRPSIIHPKDEYSQPVKK